MDLLGALKVNPESIRALAVECLALDLAAYPLLFDGTLNNKHGPTKSTYEALYSAKLLALAIALRAKFYQGVEHENTHALVAHCGLMFRCKGDEEEPALFSIKDVCDKIIHANKVVRHLEAGVREPTTTFIGTERKVQWELSMSISLFSEAILNWLECANET